MTLKDLNQLYYLRREIETLRRIRAELLARVTAINQTLTGMPGAPGKADKVGDGAAVIADIDVKIGRLLWQCETEAERLIDFIAACPDSHVRTIMEMRFLRGFGWNKCARKIGGKNSATGCVMAVQRYLSTVPEKL